MYASVKKKIYANQKNGFRSIKCSTFSKKKSGICVSLRAHLLRLEGRWRRREATQECGHQGKILLYFSIEQCFCCFLFCYISLAIFHHLFEEVIGPFCRFWNGDVENHAENMQSQIPSALPFRLLNDSMPEGQRMLEGDASMWEAMEGKLREVSRSRNAFLNCLNTKSSNFAKTIAHETRDILLQWESYKDIRKQVRGRCTTSRSLRTSTSRSSKGWRCPRSIMELCSHLRWGWGCRKEKRERRSNARNIRCLVGEFKTISGQAMWTDLSTVHAEFAHYEFSWGTHRGASKTGKFRSKSKKIAMVEIVDSSISWKTSRQ